MKESRTAAGGVRRPQGSGISMASTVWRYLGASVVALTVAILPTRALAAATPVATTTTTATPAAGCADTQACTAALLAAINRHRTRHHLAPLQLAPVQSRGARGCPGSYGHSVAMAATGGIWHTNQHFPRQSFPHNICMHYVYSGENVGESFSGVEGQDIQVLDQLMMREPHTAAVCASAVNHA